jgi:hypothetical protein
MDYVSIFEHRFSSKSYRNTSVYVLRSVWLSKY